MKNKSFSTCRLEDYVIPSADMGKDSPLPDIKNNTYIHAVIETTDNITAEEKKYIGHGMIPTLLPYCPQDGYNRDRKDKVYRAVILENENLKAVFLPELGGRLWSLVDKRCNRELLYRNPVFQPGNLALRNAWFSGGVEFNVSIKGHNPMTCSKIFAERIIMDDGSEGARFYEYERIRGVCYSFDAWIPKSAEMLYIRPRIENRTGKEIWMYWWSNIAVTDEPGTRVIVPSDEAFINYFGNDHYILDSGKMPYAFGVDATYPGKIGRSIDFFYKIPADSPKWIASLDSEGYGLIHSSTHELRGRKLFLWGQGGGGKNWNNYLSDGKNSGYVEIQAGLAYTQLEHIPMPEGEVWSWVECYGAIKCDEARVHGDWQTAKQAVGATLDQKLFGNAEAHLETLKKVAVVSDEPMCMGSGFGALENLQRAKAGKEPLSDRCKFPTESLTAAQEDFVTLLNKGKFPERDADSEPLSYVVDEEWLALLKKAEEQEENRHWYTYMHLGVMEYASGNIEGAKEMFLRSVECRENAWSLRNLAMIYKNELGDNRRATEYIRRALKLNTKTRGIILDAANIFLASELYTEWLALYDSLTDEQKKDGRFKLNCGKALMKLGRWAEAATFINSDLVMPDIKEGDTAISDVWQTLYSHIIEEETKITDKEKLAQLVEERYPLGELDFRTH